MCGHKSACGEIVARVFAVARMDVPRLVSLVANDRFYPCVEFDISAKIDCFLRRTSCAGAVDSLASCSINLSGQSLSDEKFLSFITSLLDETDFPCEKLCFEITETAAISNLVQATSFINKLRERKVCFALDDFGSGHSSFEYLRSLPVDYVKIDGSFVKNKLVDKLDEATVRSITEVAKAAGIMVVAEYVETEAIANALAEIGVDFAQGYHYGRPSKLELGQKADLRVAARSAALN